MLGSVLGPPLFRESTTLDIKGSVFLGGKGELSKRAQEASPFFLRLESLLFRPQIQICTSTVNPKPLNPKLYSSS